MKKFLGLILGFSIAWLANATPAAAQGMIAAVKSACAIQTYTVGRNNNVTMDPGGGLCLTFAAPAGGLPVSGSVSNASTSGLATSSNNIGSVSYNYGFDGTVWRQIEAIVNTGTLYDLGVHDSAVVAAINTSIPPGSALIGGTNLYDNGALNSLTNPAFMAQAEAADISGTFTNGTQTTSVTNTGADGYPTGLLSVNGTYGTASAVFEVSDDGQTTWYSVACTRSDASATETGYTALTNINRQWTCPVGGNDSLRIRSTAVASGTVNARVGISAGAQPASPAEIPSATPAAGTAHIIVTGGTAVTFVTGPIKGCYINNPTSATDQNIATAENLYVNPITTATTSAINGSSVPLVPGQSYYCVPGGTTNISANAATSSHSAVVVVW